MLRYKLLYSVLLLTTLLSIALDLTMAWFLSEIMGAAVSLNVGAFTGLIGFGLIYLLVMGLHNYVDAYLKNSISAKVRSELRLDMMRHTLALPQSSHAHQ